MRTALIIFFGVLYFASNKICLWMYPYDYSIAESHIYWDGFLTARYMMYQIQILILLIVISISLMRLKRTKMSILIPTVLVAIFVSFNIIDIAQGINTYHFHDIIIGFGAFIVCREIYLKYKRNVQQ